jgi:hypothetical protein
MKKIIRLTEKELINIVKRVINENELSEDVISVEPYLLSATKNGNVHIYNKQENASVYYSLSVWKGVTWVSLTVLDFPNGTQIKVSGLGVVKTVDINKNDIINIVKKNWGKKEIQYTTDKGEELKFKKIQ